ncbi:MAG: SMP-30/gluconolactonase/LRE family protein, partial [Alphaproteobacteria bacterium]
MSEVDVFDDRVCALGEGPLWHPERGQLFWFDILGKRLLSRDGDRALAWEFDEHVSAAGWIDAEALLIASETGLWRFDIATGARRRLAALEAGNPATRSNDGRADPFGGFWIGTMGKAAEPGLGAIWRYFRGRLERLFSGLTIPNAICFSPDGRWAFFADTPTRLIRRVALDGEGWPRGRPEALVDLATAGLNPDGAVTDAEGALWVAQWGAGRVARFDAEGRFLSALDLPAAQVSCPAFGGA